MEIRDNVKKRLFYEMTYVRLPSGRSQPASFISGMGAQNIREKLIEAVTIAQAFDLYICHLDGRLSISY